MKILVLNSGSSSLKYQLIDMENEKVLAKGNYERIGMEGSFVTHKVGSEKFKYERDAKNHEERMKVMDMDLENLKEQNRAIAEENDKRRKAESEENDKRRKAEAEERELKHQMQIEADEKRDRLWAAILIGAEYVFDQFMATKNDNETPQVQNLCEKEPEMTRAQIDDRNFDIAKEIEMSKFS